MRYIPLTQGQYTAVDDADYEWLNQWSWHYGNKAGNGHEAKRFEGGAKNKHLVLMHRRIMGVEDNRSVVVDHINGNALDNQRHNLRVCTQADNCKNQRPQLGASSPYKGVGWHTKYSRWRATIKAEGKQQHLGYFDNQEEAARVYDAAARHYFGEYAHTNFKED